MKSNVGNKVTIKDMPSYKNLYIGYKSYCKIYDDKCMVWFSLNDIRESVRFREEAYEYLTMFKVKNVIFNIRGSEAIIRYSIGVEDLFKKSKKYEKRDGRVMCKWMEVHIKNLKLVSGPPIWRLDMNQSLLQSI